MILWRNSIYKHWVCGGTVLLECSNGNFMSICIYNNDLADEVGRSIVSKEVTTIFHIKENEDTFFCLGNKYTRLLWKIPERFGTEQTVSRLKKEDALTLILTHGGSKKD